MKIPLTLSLLLFFSLCGTVLGAKKVDPYKVLGVEKNASQREIQKAFHKLSLQYHPDKNKNKGAQEKFSEINNAYEILSDEEKRKNYDLYGDEKGNPGFDAGHPGDGGGYTYFTSGGPGGNGFSFQPGNWQSSGGQGGSQSFSFSFGDQQNPFSSFGMEDMFGHLFRGGGQSGGGSKSSAGGFRASGGPRHGSKTSTKSMKTINSQVFKREIANQGMTWLLMSHTPMMKDHQYYASLVEEVSKSLEGVLKVGSINCEKEPSLCEELGVYPRRSPRLFIHKPKDSLVEYHGDLIVKDLKVFCQEHLPRFSKRADLKTLESSVPDTGNDLPSVMLLSTQKDTPLIWRALSGLYHKRINFYDALVSDVTDPKLKTLGVKSLPAIVGWLKNGERHVLKSGIAVKDKKSAIQELSRLVDDLERKNKKVAASSDHYDRDSARKKKIPILTASNLDDVCGEDVPVCIIGAFRSSHERENIESVLSKVWQKSFSRKEAVSYGLLDGSKEATFLKAFEETKSSGFWSRDKKEKKVVLIAYKPRKGKFAAYTENELNEEAVESFISSVLNGDVQFSKTRQKPKLLLS